MINSLNGVLNRKESDQVFLETGGVEWAIHMPSLLISLLPTEGSPARIFTYLQHREDQMSLFGFPTEEDRRIFLRLLSVEGIGPRQALKILSGIGTGELVTAIEAQDVDRLSRIPGVGKKTAQKIILKLKGELAVGEESEAEDNRELVLSLVTMGFERKLVEKAVKAAKLEASKDGIAAPDEKTIFNAALRRLNSGS